MSFPSPARDYAEPRISLDKELIQHPLSTFYMHAEGDSMIDAFIPPRALLVIDRSLTAKNGDIIVAVKEGEYTVRFLKKDAFSTWLCPANKKYADLQITPDMDITIWGVVTSVIMNPKDIAHVLLTRHK